MSSTKDVLLKKLVNGESLDFNDKLWLTVLLSVPAIFAQLSTILMNYIDASMVGSLGAQASASIGLVTSTTWIFLEIAHAIALGFSVQIAHRIGAKDDFGSRCVVRRSLLIVVLFGFTLMGISLYIYKDLPYWLGGHESVIRDAQLYFLVFAFRIPITLLRYYASGMLRCSGDIKVPSVLNMFMCLLDIVFNFFLIYSVHKYSVFGTEFSIPAAGLGVYGAAIGTFLADLIVTLMLLYCLLFRSKSLKLCLDKNQGVSSYIPTKRLLLSAAKIACPVAMLHVLICGAQVTVTYIIAPLGVVALAANTFGIIIESLCYMPGHGISDAATTIVGQSLGAKRKDMAKSFAWITVSLGIVVMSLLAVVMYVFCPYFLEMMTPDKGVVELATTVIRLACFAEPFYAAYIVCFGVFLGACDTFKSAMFNLLTMWGVRIILASFIAPVYGLVGVWIAMCIELFIRGVIFLVRLHKGSWMDKYRPSETDVIN